ncbi:DUF6221 family protein [Nonomuraea sp. 10N515B]|uniref:DUF6221 family protein n=1 Tax=Nonomuraea sp. 10N515B TaxID=3457422 RepID=UPI003FCD8057
MIAFVRACLDEDRDSRRTQILRRLFDRLTATKQLVHEDEEHGQLLRHLAARYRSRPGYREEWWPQTPPRRNISAKGASSP